MELYPQSFGSIGAMPYRSPSDIGIQPFIPTSHNSMINMAKVLQFNGGLGPDPVESLKPTEYKSMAPDTADGMVGDIVSDATATEADDMSQEAEGSGLYPSGMGLRPTGGALRLAGQSRPWAVAKWTKASQVNRMMLPSAPLASRRANNLISSEPPASGAGLIHRTYGDTSLTQGSGIATGPQGFGLAPAGSGVATGWPIDSAGNSRRAKKGRSRVIEGMGATDALLYNTRRMLKREARRRR